MRYSHLRKLRLTCKRIEIITKKDANEEHTAIMDEHNLKDEAEVYARAVCKKNDIVVDGLCKGSRPGVADKVCMLR